MPIFFKRHFSDNPGVRKTPTTNPFLLRLDAIGAERTPPLSRHAIAMLAGVDEGTIRKLENRPGGGPTAKTLSKIAAALGMRPAELLDIAPTPRRPSGPEREREVDDLPLLGVAAGAAIGSFVIRDNPIDWLPRPPALRHVKDAYAVYIENDSMAPLHTRGDLRFVDPNRPARTGDSVIVLTLDEKGERHAWIKILEKRVEGWVVCRQLNPPAEVRYKADQIAGTQRVLTTAELFNR